MEEIVCLSCKWVLVGYRKLFIICNIVCLCIWVGNVIFLVLIIGICFIKIVVFFCELIESVFDGFMFMVLVCMNCFDYEVGLKIYLFKVEIL